MKFYSETLKKMFDSVEDLEQAETDHEEQVAKVEAEQKALKTEYAVLKAEMDSAWKDYSAKRKAYLEFLEKHNHVSDTIESLTDLIRKHYFL